MFRAVSLRVTPEWSTGGPAATPYGVGPWPREPTAVTTPAERSQETNSCSGAGSMPPESGPVRLPDRLPVLRTPLDHRRGLGPPPRAGLTLLYSSQCRHLSRVSCTLRGVGEPGARGPSRLPNADPVRAERRRPHRRKKARGRSRRREMPAARSRRRATGSTPTIARTAAGKRTPARSTSSGVLRWESMSSDSRADASAPTCRAASAPLMAAAPTTVSSTTMPASSHREMTQRITQPGTATRIASARSVA